MNNSPTYSHSPSTKLRLRDLQAELDRLHEEDQEESPEGSPEAGPRRTRRFRRASATRLAERAWEAIQAAGEPECPFPEAELLEAAVAVARAFHEAAQAGASTMTVPELAEDTAIHGRHLLALAVAHEAAQRVVVEGGWRKQTVPGLGTHWSRLAREV